MGATSTDSEYIRILAAVGGAVLVYAGMKIARALPQVRLKVGIERLEP